MKFCQDCGVAIGNAPYIQRCTGCQIDYASRRQGALGQQYEAKGCNICTAEAPHTHDKPLANNCGVCGKNPIVTAWGVCAFCYKPPAPPASKPQRPSWDDYFFDMAKLVSTRATCPRASVGVVLVDAQHRVIATGYNGAVSGEPHCVDVGCEIYAEHCMRARHGEESALMSAAIVLRARVGMVDFENDFLQEYDVTVYVSAPLPVCTSCARKLRDAGVTDVKWRES